MKGKASEAEPDFERSLRLAPALKAALETRINRVKQETATGRKEF
jgi:hypothetical protein